MNSCYIVRFFYYYNPLHFSSNTVLIIRRSNCINTASGVVFSVSVRLVAYREYYTGCCINTIWPPDDEHSVARKEQRIIIINVYTIIANQVGNLTRVPVSSCKFQRHLLHTPKIICTLKTASSFDTTVLTEYSLAKPQSFRLKFLQIIQQLNGSYTLKNLTQSQHEF